MPNEPLAAFLALKGKYGTSAATTYDWLRQQNQRAAFAWRVMHNQLAALGVDYGGGFDCVPFRKAREV